MNADDGTDEHGLRSGDLTGAIIREFFAVYGELGHGFLESVYESAMALALAEAGLRVERQASLAVWFRGTRVGEFRADLLVEGTVVVELKAARTIEPAHEAQLLNCLKASDIELGLLLNFGPKPEIRRKLFDRRYKGHRVRPCRRPRSSVVSSS